MAIQAQEAQRSIFTKTPYNQPLKNQKQRNFKPARGKRTITYKEIPTRLLAETLQVRREWGDIFKVFKGKKIFRYTNDKEKELEQGTTKNDSKKGTIRQPESN